MESAKILSIQVGKPKTYRRMGEEGEDQSWISGIFKSEVLGPVFVGEANLDGDGQADLNVHGGPDRAVLMLGTNQYSRWTELLGSGRPCGSFGENLTIDSLSESSVCLGDIWQTRKVELEVSQPRLPCFKLSRRLESEGFHLLAMKENAIGWYCRTLKSGHVQAGDDLSLVSRPNPLWTVERAFRTFMDAESKEELQQLASLPSLSALWKSRLSKLVMADGL
ncbi:MAG TPA: MOSC domain-containing protein [Fimbriimonadaceae bacterium]|nr:MOSC domain-containing protein [Fimbriimonadaceae bacterium]